MTCYQICIFFSIFEVSTTGVSRTEFQCQLRENFRPLLKNFQRDTKLCICVRMVESFTYTYKFNVSKGANVWVRKIFSSKFADLVSTIGDFTLPYSNFYEKFSELILNTVFYLVNTPCPKLKKMKTVLL